MKITYDKRTDALYIKLKKGHYDHTKKITDEILVDVSKKGEVLGLEILEAKRNIGNLKQPNLPINIASL